MLILSAAILTVTMGQSASGTAGRAAEQERLEACIAKINENAAEAYEDGLAWVNEGGRPFARQCTALALIELGHAAEGAVRLEDLANADNGGSIRQRVIYLTQSGNAWLLAGAPDAALVTLNNAIKLNPNDPNLYADRAAAYMELEKWEEAEIDLDLAYQSLSNDTTILKMRAETRLNLQDLDGAELDIKEAMAIDISDVQTLLLRGRIREAQRVRAEDEVIRTVSPTIIGQD